MHFKNVQAKTAISHLWPIISSQIFSIQCWKAETSAGLTTKQHPNYTTGLIHSGGVMPWANIHVAILPNLCCNRSWFMNTVCDHTTQNSTANSTTMQNAYIQTALNRNRECNTGWNGNQCLLVYIQWCNSSFVSAVLAAMKYGKET